MEKSQLTTLFLSIALGFGGAVVMTNPNALHYLNALSPVEFVTGYDPHSDTIGGEHPTAIIVSGDEREVFPRQNPVLFKVTNNFPQVAAVSYSFVLADELGNEIIAEPTSKVKVFGSHETIEYKLFVPQTLGEGLYSFQVTAAGRSKGEFADSGVELNFAILNGSVYMLNNEEWLKFSLANGASSQQ